METIRIAIKACRYPVDMQGGGDDELDGRITMSTKPGESHGDPAVSDEESLQDALNEPKYEMQACKGRGAKRPSMTNGCNHEFTDGCLEEAATDRA